MQIAMQEDSNVALKVVVIVLIEETGKGIQ